MKTTNYLTQLPQEISIIKIESLPDSEHLFLKIPIPKERLCPYCGSSHCIIKDSGSTQTVRHVPLCNKSVYLTFHKRRLLCKNCNTSFYEEPYWIQPSTRMTFALYRRIQLDLLRNLSQKEIAVSNGITESIISSVLESFHFDKPSRLPTTLCIDEFKSDSGIWNNKRRRWMKNKYHCNIADGDSGSIIDVLDQINATYLIKYFNQYPKELRSSVKFYCCDMHNGFVSVAKKCFPHAVICIDMFHVIKRLNSMVDDIRYRIQKYYQEHNDTENYRKLKAATRLFKTNRTNQMLYWKEHYAENQLKLKAAFALSTEL